MHRPTPTAASARPRPLLRPTIAASVAAAAALATGPAAVAQPRGRLQPPDVLVVYDSRDAGALELAELYAGSAAVIDATRGGTAAGGVIGTRQGVRALDLATTGEPNLTGSDITIDEFIGGLRDPIREHLLAHNLVGRVRALVLVRGTPHRVLDFDDPADAADGGGPTALGDLPSAQAAERTSGDASNASVDAELALLWQDLLDDEAGSPLDSRADGPIVNPYAGSTLPLSAIGTETILDQNPLLAVDSGAGQQGRSFGPVALRLSPGDLLAVCRLDGVNFTAVAGVIDRGSAVLYDTDAHRLLLDESASLGTVSPPGNGELDNAATSFGNGDDYELARDLLLGDGRFAPGAVLYDGAPGGDAFFFGPNIDLGGQGIIVEEPVILLASEGQNHGGGPAGGISGGLLYGQSFNYPPGAAFNSIESVNGRAFNGLGQLFNQEQAADFLNLGGTFALANVYEPLSDTLPDNRPFVESFTLGDLTFAEAAYAAMPALSWMQIALGDPLAVATRTSEDLNADGRVDDDDLYAFDLAPADVDRDGLITPRDRSLVEASVRADEKADRRCPRARCHPAEPRPSASARSSREPPRSPRPDPRSHHAKPIEERARKHGGREARGRPRRPAAGREENQRRPPPPRERTAAHTPGRGGGLGGSSIGRRLRGRGAVAPPWAVVRTRACRS